MDDRTRILVKNMLLERAADDPAFRAALLLDAAATIKENFGYSLPPGITMRVLEETREDVYVVLPRPAPTRDSIVTLQEITADTVRSIIALEVKEEQKELVAPNAVSIAQAHFAPLAWMRAIYADDTPVGFVMLRDDPTTREYYLWRFMIAGPYQAHGFGLQALRLTVDYVRTRPGATEMTLSYVPEEGSPRGFYARLGFVDTGEQHGGENVMRLTL